MNPRRAAPRPHAPRLQASSPDPRVLGEPEDARTFAELLIDCEEVIRHGGPRDGDSMGWVVIDRVPDDAKVRPVSLHRSDGTKADAEAKADQLRAEGGPG